MMTRNTLHHTARWPLGEEMREDVDVLERLRAAAHVPSTARGDNDSDLRRRRALKGREGRKSDCVRVARIWLTRCVRYCR